MKDLRSILKAVSRGKMDVAKAEVLIQKIFENSISNSDGAARESKPSGRLADRIGLGTLLKKSRSWSRRVDFTPDCEGFDCNLSIFSAVEFSKDSLVEANTVSASQWRDVHFTDAAEVRKNHLTLSQVASLSCQRSNFSENEFGLARLTGLTIQESRFEENRLSRSVISDVSLSEADFTGNRLLRSELSGVVLNASRMSKLVLVSCQWSECEVDQSDLQGLRFENCSFHECRFSNCEIVADGHRTLTDLHLKGVVFEGVRSYEEFTSLIGKYAQTEPESNTPTGAARAVEPGRRRHRAPRS
jgi:uncharacterized protein YjbI with pentapeptide repeats